MPSLAIDRSALERAPSQDHVSLLREIHRDTVNLIGKVNGALTLDNIDKDARKRYVEGHRALYGDLMATLGAPALDGDA